MIVGEMKVDMVSESHFYCDVEEEGVFFCFGKMVRALLVLRI